MKYLPPFKRRNPQHILLTLSFISLLSVNACKQNTSSSESELINKINAVHKQIMVQGNISEEEKLAIAALYSLVSGNDGTNANSLDGAILYKDVANVPTYPACEGTPDEGTRKCFTESVSTFIQQEFNASIPTNSEPQQVAVFFVIDEHGDLTSMKIRDAEVTVQAEIARVLRKIPKMKPATQEGANVPVLCSILVTYGSKITIEHMYIPKGSV